MKNAKEKKQSTGLKKLEKDLKQAVAEVKLIEAGILKPRPIREVLEEIKESRGGPRKGSGRKSPVKDKYPDEVKKPVTLRLYPTQLKEIVEKYGSLQSAVDSLS